MLGGGKYSEVVNLVERWVPDRQYQHEKRFQDELQGYLETELNQSGGLLGGGAGQEDIVEKEHGTERADIAVNGEIAIELKRDLTNSQRKKLRGQVEDLLDNYPYVIVCSCGVKDVDGWKRVQQDINDSQLDVSKGEVAFVWKKKENMGKSRGRSSKGGNSGGFLDDDLLDF